VADLELIASKVIDVAFQIHRELGPGLLESVYAGIAVTELQRIGLRVERNKRVGFTYRGVRCDNGLTLDLVVNDALVIELKSAERIAPVHLKQLLTYLRALNLPLGLLLNFGEARMADGIRRVVNGYEASPSRRRVR
jgi:GxxExxY protein